MIYILLVLSLWLASWAIWRYYFLSSGAESTIPAETIPAEIKQEEVGQVVQRPTTILFGFYDDIKNDLDEDPPTVVMPRSKSIKNKL